MLLTDWHGITMGAFLIWLSPVTITVVIYAYTWRYIHRYSQILTVRQQARIIRDFTVIRRILWLNVFPLVFGTPEISLTIVYYVSGYIGWWANYLSWFTCILSFIGMSIIHTRFSPHLRVLWSRRPNRINPNPRITLRNLQ
ncbi:unnamed protein product [Adineta steineri]|uniref:G protein-coupled receptor n=1 Tax=Adineta steineri TaxID=433720 RepID=A0A814AND3_9BILA|nr:unnamed protein product [Adineta steineri]CAF4042180.1 unnamed protein product [Adineta steineri]